MTDRDQAAGVRPKRRFLTSIRDALFENTSEQGDDSGTPRAPNTSNQTDTSSRASANPHLATEPASSDVDAARAVLRKAVEAQLGPGIREFSLQNDALSEALPDLAVRRNAALRVLAVKALRASTYARNSRARSARSPHKARSSRANCATGGTP